MFRAKKPTKIGGLVSREDFELLTLVGKGAFGKVATHTPSREPRSTCSWHYLSARAVSSSSISAD